MPQLILSGFFFSHQNQKKNEDEKKAASINLHKKKRMFRPYVAGFVVVMILTIVKPWHREHQHQL